MSRTANSRRPPHLVVVKGGKVSGEARTATSRQLGLRVFLISLGVLFAATTALFVFLRLTSPSWRITDVPGLSAGLLLSTTMMLGACGAVTLALRGVRRNDERLLRRALVGALVLGIGFVFSQMLTWLAFAEAQTTMSAGKLYGFTFYSLTGVHALHVLGGLAPLAVVTRRAIDGRYSPLHYDGVRLCARYWQFIGGVWVFLLGAMFFLL